MKKVGIITFHSSYNCGSMLQTYALQTYLKINNIDAIVIDYSAPGQKDVYSVFSKKISIKSILKNLLILPFHKKIERNNYKYEEFKNQHFYKTQKIENYNDLIDKDFSVVVTGSDQVWNITIEDFDDAYFLPWVSTANKVAYAPSFGAKNILKYSENPETYSKMIKSFDALSIREQNGQKWLKELTGLDVEVLIDPTLLLEQNHYDKIIDNSLLPEGEYIFLYCPSFNMEICRFVKKISQKYNLPVMTWSAKSYYVKMIYRFGFIIPDYENPAIYLSLIKHAKLIFTTSFHGTIFSTIYRKNFYTIKNGGMYGEDDRVLTLVKSLKIEDRVIPYDFDNSFDYLKKVDYENYEKILPVLKLKAETYIKNNIGEIYESTK